MMKKTKKKKNNRKKRKAKAICRQNLKNIMMNQRNRKKKEGC